MKFITASFIPLVGIMLLLVGCNKQIQPTQTSNKPSFLNSRNVTSAEANKILATRGLLKPLPRYQPFLNTPNRQLLLRKFQSETAEPCNDYTPFYAWINDQLRDWTVDEFNAAFGLAMIDIPMLYAIIFENNSAGQYFGIKGEYTQINTKTFKDLRRFWDIPSDKIVHAAMHGAILNDKQKVMAVLETAFGLSVAESTYFAELITALTATVPQFRQGNHPIFSINAIAMNGMDEVDFYLPPKIIMGDGIQMAFDDLGFGDVAPQCILAHEYEHLVQYHHGTINDEVEPTAESTRRVELMADAGSAYFASHSRGAAMQWKRVQLYLQVFFNIGDCQLTAPFHHGTPSQRMAAGEWGNRLVSQANNQGSIHTSTQFTQFFDAALPQILTH